MHTSCPPHPRFAFISGIQICKKLSRSLLVSSLSVCMCSSPDMSPVPLWLSSLAMRCKGCWGDGRVAPPVPVAACPSQALPFSFCLLWPPDLPLSQGGRGLSLVRVSQCPYTSCARWRPGL